MRPFKRSNSLPSTGLSFTSTNQQTTPSIISTTSNYNAEHGKNLRNWFLKLTPEERGRVLSFEDKEGTALLRKMFKKQEEEGVGLFYSVDDPFVKEAVARSTLHDNKKKTNRTKRSASSPTVSPYAAALILPDSKPLSIPPLVDDNYFCFMKLSCLLSTCFYPERLLIIDKKLEDAIRLCDTREYLDTLTIASNLLEDGKQFIRLMEVVTRGNFLSQPCKGESRLC